MSASRQEKLACVMANLLDHYDLALYGLLGPVIAPLFFDAGDPFLALLLTYAILPLGLITRPLGALFFGRIGDSRGRAPALVLSLSGVSISTFSIAFLPTYQEIGIWAPLGLAISRMAQSFFAAGETCGGALFLLEKTDERGRTFMGSLYDASTVAGILIASMAVFEVVRLNAAAWRLLFLGGGITALLALFLRVTAKSTVHINRVPTSLHEGLWQYRYSFFSISLASGIGHITYNMAFPMMNIFLPKISSHTFTDTVFGQIYLLVIDLLLLPIFGWIATQIGRVPLMRMSLVALVLFSIPSFLFLEGATSYEIFIVRIFFVVLGVAFSAPYHAWAMSQVPVFYRFRILALASTLGGQLIGAPSIAISIWIYRETGWVFAPAIWITIFAFTGLLILSRKQLCDEVIELNPNENIEGECNA